MDRWRYRLVGLHPRRAYGGDENEPRNTSQVGRHGESRLLARFEKNSVQRRSTDVDVSRAVNGKRCLHFRHRIFPFSRRIRHRPEFRKGRLLDGAVFEVRP